MGQHMNGNLFDLTGRAAVVTGAASGLGQAMAVGLARQGADVACADINDDGLAETAREIEALGRMAVSVRCDISKAEDITHLFDEADRAFGRVDILINNAYMPSRARPEELSLDEWERSCASTSPATSCVRRRPAGV